MMTWNRVDLPEPVLPAISAVLAGAFADGEVLQLGRARAADGHAQLAGGVLAPNFGFRRGDMGEGHFDAAGIPAAAADLVDELGGELRRTAGHRATSSAPGMGLAGEHEIVAFAG